MKKQEIENLIEKVNKAFKVDLRSKTTKRLNFYLRCIIASKTDLHDVVVGEMFDRDRVTMMYSRKQFKELKNYLDFKDLIKKVEEL